MLGPWKWYQNCLAVHPLQTQVVTSGFLWGIGDVVAQSITHHSISKKRLAISATAAKEELLIDWKRVAITSMFGVGFVGPFGHFWYEGLDQFIKVKLQVQPNSARFIATKVGMDVLLFGPLSLFTFFTYMGFSSGKSASQVKETLKKDFFPALLLESGVWPVIQAANFRYVPLMYQLLYVNVFYFLDSAFLSWYEQQKDAAWKQRLASFSPNKPEDREQ